MTRESVQNPKLAIPARPATSTVSAFLVAAAFLLAPAVDCRAQVSQAKAPTARQQGKLLQQIGHCLEASSFVLGTTFEDWPTRAAEAREALERAPTSGEFTQRLNRVLLGYGVSHLNVIDPQLWKLWRAGSEIGAGFKTLVTEGGERRVNLVLPQSPAARLGLRKGDLILSVDRHAQETGSTFDHAFSPGGRLLPNGNDERWIEWQRSGESHRGSLSFDKHPAALPLELAWKPEAVAWVTINSFKSTYDAAKVEQIFDEIAARQATGVVLDLRANGGGDSRHDRHLASMLLPADTIVGRRLDRNMPFDPQAPLNLAGEALIVPAGNQGRRFDGPVVVLIDAGSGSGGEFFPGYLQQLGRATLIGQRTAGSLLGGSWCELAKGYRLLFPVEEALLADGGRIEGVGVQPDIEVSADALLDDQAITDLAVAALKSGSP